MKVLSAAVSVGVFIPEKSGLNTAVVGRLMWSEMWQLTMEEPVRNLEQQMWIPRQQLPIYGRYRLKKGGPMLREAYFPEGLEG